MGDTYLSSWFDDVYPPNVPMILQSSQNVLSSMASSPDSSGRGSDGGLAGNHNRCVEVVLRDMAQVCCTLMAQRNVELSKG